MSVLLLPNSGWPLLKKRMDVFPQDLIKSRSREILAQIISIILKSVLPRCLSNLRAIGSLQHPISQLRYFAKFGGKTFVRLVNRGPETVPSLDCERDGVGCTVFYHVIPGRVDQSVHTHPWDLCRIVTIKCSEGDTLPGFFHFYFHLLINLSIRLSWKTLWKAGGVIGFGFDHMETIVWLWMF